MSGEGPRLAALLRAVPFFTRLEPVDLARLVGALALPGWQRLGLLGAP